MSNSFDAIIIGTGQSGPSLAERFAQQGLRVAVIERKYFGGTCVNTGCVPTKTLVASAYVAHMARRAADYGVDIGGPIKVDMERVKARKDGIVAKSRNGVKGWMEGLAQSTVYHGHARFTGPKTVSVNGEVLEADRIIINTGGRALVPAMSGLDRVPYFTNSSMMEVDFLPEHLLIIGGSYIGLEFAQAYRRFGARVTVVEMGERLIAREDPDVSKAVREILEGEGIEVRLNAECIAVEKDGNGVAMRVDCSTGAPVVQGSHLLLAVGRQPNTDDLDLERAGVTTDAKGFITVDDQCRTNVAGIWAVGDVNGRGAFTHTSYNDFEIVAANLFDNDRRRISDRIPCYALFIDPPLGRVGMTEREARANGIEALAAKRMMTTVGRARERGETLGFMKVMVDAASKKVLGAAILGLAGDEVVHAFLDVMAAGAPYTAISRTMHIHPTVAEYLPTMLGDLKPLA
ncbi:MAG TPA: FAD-containing oxidoreductase [Alphaproteobacteria bacterium]|nr:FAD-containing oxidoreductase [Alphaproteobacteria bacterium]